MEIERALEQALTRLQQGEAIEAILADHPEHAQELAELLPLAGQLRGAAWTEARPEFRREARRRLLARLDRAPSRPAGEAELAGALERALTELGRGGEPDAVLSQLARHGPELPALVDLARRLGRWAEIQPRPEFRAQARERLMRRIRQPAPVLGPGERLRSAVTRLRAGLAPGARSEPGWPGRPLMLRAASAVLTLAILGAGTVWASTDSLPGDPLYSVKRAVETARLAAARDAGSRVRLTLGLAERRLEEAELVLGEGDTRGAARTVVEFHHAMDRAQAAALREPASQDDLLQRVDRDWARGQTFLEALLAAVAPPERASLEDVLIRSREAREQVRGVLGEAPGGAEVQPASTDGQATEPATGQPATPHGRATEPAAPVPAAAETAPPSPENVPPAPELTPPSAAGESTGADPELPPLPGQGAGLPPTGDGPAEPVIATLVPPPTLP